MAQEPPTPHRDADGRAAGETSGHGDGDLTRRLATTRDAGTSGDGDLTWRLATTGDAGALVDLIRAAYRGPASHERWTSEEHLVGGTRTDQPSVLAAIDGDGSQMLVVDGADGRPTGCCRIADRGDGLVSFGMFAVDPGRQGVGLGRRLVGWAQDAAVDLFDARLMELEVLAQQELLRGWYERLGFAPTGETRPFPAHPEYAVPRRDDLYLIVLAKSLRTGGGV